VGTARAGAVATPIDGEASSLAGGGRSTTAAEFEEADESANQRYHFLQNISPKWNKKQKGYVLPFFGRVKLASAKNFQLMEGDDDTNILFMFGKVKKDHYSLDFRHPLSLMDAFGVAISSLLKKRAVS
jgi:tubby-related protein 1